MIGDQGWVWAGASRLHGGAEPTQRIQLELVFEAPSLPQRAAWDVNLRVDPCLLIPEYEPLRTNLCLQL